MRFGLAMQLFLCCSLSAQVLPPGWNSSHRSAEKVQVGDWIYETLPAQWGDIFGRVQADAKFLVLGISAVNTGQSAAVLPPFLLLNDKGQRFTPTSPDTCNVFEQCMPEGKLLNPGVILKGLIAFDVPPGSYKLAVFGSTKPSSYELLDFKFLNEESSTAPAITEPGHHSTPPHLIFSVDPEFSDQARNEKFQGKVVLSIVVNTRGLPDNIHIVRSAGHGLDEQAIKAVRQYRFQPATSLGNPVPAEINIEVNFQLDVDTPPAKKTKS